MRLFNRELHSDEHADPPPRQRLRAAPGPRRRGGRRLDLLPRAVRSEPPTVFGDGLQTRDFVYVGDVVRRSWPRPTPAPRASSTSAPAARPRCSS